MLSLYFLNIKHNSKVYFTLSDFEVLGATELINTHSSTEAHFEEYSVIVINLSCRSRGN